MKHDTCPKCGSDNISFQREQTASVGGGLHSHSGKKGHGILWWLLIGWWCTMLKWVGQITLAFCTMGISLLFRRKRRDKISGKTVTATKIFNRTVAVCQNCGNTWKA